MDCTLDINNDDEVEDTEDINFFATVTGNRGFFAQGRGMATVNINDDDDDDKGKAKFQRKLRSLVASL